MKSAVIALFLGATSAVKLNDAPPYFNEPTWNERMPSAGGFLMVSACVNSGVAGLTCQPPNSQLFATCMNGDEDLGEDIIMKGKPFHYNQKLAQEAPEEGSASEEKAEAKEDEKMKEADAKAAKAKVKNVEPAEKVSVLETAIAKEHTTFYDKKAPKSDEFAQLVWVELPDCDGTPGEKKLMAGNGNASWATCKMNPKVSAIGKKQAADAALDSLTPKAEK